MSNISVQTCSMWTVTLKAWCIIYLRKKTCLLGEDEVWIGTRMIKVTCWPCLSFQEDDIFKTFCHLGGNDMKHTLFFQHTEFFTLSELASHFGRVKHNYWPCREPREPAQVKLTLWTSRFQGNPAITNYPEKHQHLHTCNNIHVHVHTHVHTHGVPIRLSLLDLNVMRRGQSTG